MKNYIISLAAAEQRRAHIIEEFGKQAIVFEFFDAITPHQVGDLARQFDIEIHDGHLTQGELACLFSHVCLWQKMIDDDLDCMAVFEDDVCLGDNAKSFLHNAAWIPNQCHLLKIEYFMENLYLGKSIHDFLGRQIKPLEECNWGTAGYIIKKEMVHPMLHILRQQFTKKNIPIDHIMFLTTIRDYKMTVHQLTPAICIQSDRRNPDTSLISDLENERKFKKQKAIKERLSLGNKLYKEIKRPFMQIKSFCKYLGKKREIVAFK